MHITAKINKLYICCGTGPYIFTHEFHVENYVAVVPYVYVASEVFLQSPLNDLNY